jgi:hypothetical protein
MTEENNNNRAERAIKAFVIGVKGCVAGPNGAAIIYSLVETCKWHGVEQYDWFRYDLKAIPLCSEDEHEMLLPFNIDRKLLAK